MTEMVPGHFAVRIVQVSYYADKRSIRTGWAITPLFAQFYWMQVSGSTRGEADDAVP
jgi:hypothetical protein